MNELDMLFKCEYYLRVVVDALKEGSTDEALKCAEEQLNDLTKYLDGDFKSRF